MAKRDELNAEKRRQQQMSLAAAAAVGRKTASMSLTDPSNGGGESGFYAGSQSMLPEGAESNPGVSNVRINEAEDVAVQSESPVAAAAAPPKMMKVQFGSVFNLEEVADDDGGGPSAVQPVNEEPKMAKLRFNLGDTGSATEENFSDVERKMEEMFQDEADDVRETSDDRRSPHNDRHPSAAEIPSDGREEVRAQRKSTAMSSKAKEKFLKVHYQNYDRRILKPELRRIMSKSYLYDVLFVCRDGDAVAANSLVMGSMSPFLRTLLLTETPAVDRLRLVMMPDVNAADLELFNRMLFNERGIEKATIVEMRKIKAVASLLR